MNCSGKDEVERAEIFREKYGRLINETEMRKRHLNEGQKIPCSSCVYGKLIAHKSTARR